MEYTQRLTVAIMKVRLMADISSDAQCKANEFGMVFEIISDLAKQALDEIELEKTVHH
jgi:hypothetical protein